MFIPISPALLRSQDYDACLRVACDELSSKGISNYIHYAQPVTVEFLNPKRLMIPAINYLKYGIELRERTSE